MSWLSATGEKESPPKPGDHPGPSAEYKDMTGWRDITTEITVRSTGAAAPSFSAFRNGIYAYEFPHTANREFFMTFHIQHDWKRGTPLYLHVHFAPGNSALSGNVKWGMEYTIAKGHQQGAGSVFGATQTTSATIAVGASSNYEHHIAELSTGISSSQIEVDSLLLVRFYRDTTVASNFGASVWGFTADIHYQYDRYGTLNKSPDFYRSP